MDKNKILNLLILIVPELIKEIVTNEDISDDEATFELYNSELYSKLEDEETKLWHLSPKALYELYKQEKTTGKIEYPMEQ